MRTTRTLAVVVLSVLLTVTLLGATVATGVERTALDDQYVVETFEEENVGSEIGTELREDIATEVERSDERQQIPTGIAIDLDGEAVANRSVTDGFVASELRRNIRIGVQYLRGNEPELALRTDLRETKESVRAEIISGTTVDTPQLIGANTARIGAERVAMLSEGQQEYRDARLALTDQERSDLEAEMETNVRRQLPNDSERLTEAVLAHQTTVLDGVTGAVSYEEYVERLAADERRIKAVIADIALGEIPDEQSLLEEDEDPESALGPARTASRLTVTFAWLLPLLAVGLVGAVYAATRSTDRTAMVAGTGLFASGVLGALLGFVAAPGLKGAAGLGGEESDPVVRGLIAVVDGTFRTIGTQSLGLAVAGVIALAAVIADRRGLFDGVREQLDPRRERQ